MAWKRSSVRSRLAPPIPRSRVSQEISQTAQVPICSGIPGHSFLGRLSSLPQRKPHGIPDTNYQLARWACLFQRKVHVREQLVLRRIALQIQIMEIDWEVTQLLSAMR